MEGSVPWPARRALVTSRSGPIGGFGPLGPRVAVRWARDRRSRGRTVRRLCRAGRPQAGGHALAASPRAGRRFGAAPRSAPGAWAGQGGGALSVRQCRRLVPTARVEGVLSPCPRRQPRPSDPYVKRPFPPLLSRAQSWRGLKEGGGGGGRWWGLSQPLTTRRRGLAGCGPRWPGAASRYPRRMLCRRYRIGIGFIGGPELVRPGGMDGDGQSN